MIFPTSTSADVGGLDGIEGMVAQDRRPGRGVIDNRRAGVTTPTVTLVVPEVNADAVGGFRKRGIIANPNCSTPAVVG